MKREYDAVPLTLVDDSTARIDAETMEAAVQLCRESDAQRAQLVVRVKVAGERAAVTLRPHRISATGIVLEVPSDVALDVAEGAVAVVQLQLAGTAPSRLVAHVVHRRRAATGVPGGISLRWDTSDPRTRAEIARAIPRFTAAI